MNVRSFRTLILSLALHIFLSWLLMQLPPLELRPHTARETVQWMDTAQLSAKDREKEKQLFDEKPFVRKAMPPRELLTNDEKPARFSSEDKQFVLEERKAHKSGLTANRSQEAVRAQPHSPGEKMQRQATSSIVNHDKTTGRRKTEAGLDLNPKSSLQSAIAKEIAESRQPLMGKGRGDVQVSGLDANGGGSAGKRGSQSRDKARNPTVPLDLPNFMGLEKGDSTVGESLPDDIKFGEFTALNTDRNLFYSFYSRMEEVVRPPWVRYARAALYSYETGARKLTGHETWATKVEILLDRNGNYVKAVIHEGSGVTTLDVAPVDAFRSAHQFPHPPAEMVKADGFIHIYCMFTVSVAPQYASGEE